jgi:cytochrome c biogenesis protein CcmG/thiol:disulfide interchange protein DsbE
VTRSLVLSRRRGRGRDAFATAGKMPALPFLLLIILINCLLLPSCYSGSRPPRIGEVAPDFTVQDVDRTVSLRQFRGQVLVLNFWGTFCPPCIEEMPSLISMAQSEQAKGVSVLGISIDVDADAYHKFLTDHGVKFLTVRDPDEKTATVYGTHGWPETYIIDRSGVVRRKFIGPVDWNSPEIRSYLEKL